MNAGTIDAVLTLNATSFDSGLKNSLTAVENFKNTILQFPNDVSKFSRSLEALSKDLNDVATTMNEFNSALGNMKNVKDLGQFMKNVSESIRVLSKDTVDLEKGMTAITNIFKAWGDTVGNTTLKIEGVTNAIRQLVREEVQEESATQKANNLEIERINTLRRLQKELNTVAMGIEKFNSIDATSDSVKRLQSQVQLMESEFQSAQKWLLEFANTGVESFNRIGRSVDTYVAKTQMLRLPNTSKNLLDSGDKLTQSNALIEQNSQAMQKNGAEILRNMGYRGKLTIEEEKETVAKEKNTQSAQRNINAMNRQATATTGLGRAMSSLRMMTTMVGSMIAYNFVHNLAMATTETIHSKSEMEGYFQMMHLGTGQINDFNKALEETVKLYPRLNKYNLGETISSVGVEFDLSIDEMKKAMPIVSMITSEYLRAGRNANEASLAVKDILQGEFQRLSRETGVKKEDLEEAGWSGDNTDVMGLLDALDKVGKSRNWDEFVAKANSLNDIILILQNRFGEWSADMVNVVQPSIVSAFNGIMGVAEGFAGMFTNLWQWFNGGSWGAIATQVGLFGGALLTVSQALVMYRGQMGLVEASQLGLSKSIGTLVLGLKGEEIAHVGVINAIKSKILGVEAEAVAERGTAIAIRERQIELKLEEIQERINGATTKENTLAKELNALQTKLSALAEEGLITAKSKETIEEELNTVAKELNTVSTVEQEGANTGLLASIYALVVGEELLIDETGVLTAMWEILTGVFMLSPIGWLTGLVLGLASAFYVLTGGLSDAWGKMQTFNDNVEKGNDALKPYWDNVAQTSEKLEEAKEKYGENSEQVKTLEDDLRNAKGSFDDFRESLQKGVKTSQNLNEELEQLSPKLDSITRKNFGELNLGEEKTDEFLETMDAMGYGREQYYTALQKLVRMEGNFYDAQKEAIPVLTEHNRTTEEGARNLGNFNDKYKQFIEHSTKANTAEDWWTWAWESFWASQSKAEVDSTVLTAKFENIFRDLPNTLKSWIDNAVSGNFFKDDASKLFDGVNEWLGKGLDGAVAQFKNWIYNEVPKSLGDSFTDLQEMWTNNLVEPISSFFGDIDILGMIFDAIFPDPVSASDGGADHPSFMEDVSNIIGFDIQTWLTNFSSDPLGTLGVELPTFDIGALFGALTSSDDGTSILTWVNDNVVTPLSNGIITGIANIPIIGTIAQMLGLVPMENDNAYQTGYNLIDNLKRGVEQKIGEIPIIGDIARMLGLIPQEQPHAQQEGHGIGSSISSGTKNGMGTLGSEIVQEFSDALGGIGKLGEEAYNTARGWADQLWQGVNSILQRHSPGFFHDQFQLEFGQDIPNAISEASSTAYSVAQTYGQQISDGISATNFNTIGFDSAVGEYQADAQMVADSSYLMGTTTTTAFNDMTLAVNQSTMNMQGNVVSSYSTMQQSQSQLLNNMKQSNTTAYNEMYQKSNQSLLQMRDSTSNVTHQMINAWDHMKNSIIASANQLKSDSTAHFNQLSNTIGDFYRKIQNPSNWGAGSGSNGAMVRGARHSSAGKSFAGAITRRATHHGAGGSSLYNGREEMSVGALKRMICPNGDCGNLFNGYSMTDKVNVEDFIASITGEHGFGWGDWSGRHYDYIKTTSDAWSMASPVINLVGGIPTNSSFKVGDFENGTPNISFDSFVSMAEAIFSRIPYRYYYDSSWKGSWLGALQAGACNCSDGADALMAFAQTCNPNWSVSKQWGKWGKDGHFWAVINGKVMDTTAWQGGYGWTSPKVSGYGSPVVRRANPSSDDGYGNNKTLNVNIEISGTVYGVEDLDDKIQESVKAGLREEFNDPYTVAI